jgi:hypothetical protein
MSRVSNRTRRKTQMKSRRVRRVRRVRGGSKIRKRKRIKTRQRVKRGGSPTRTNMISTATSMVGQKSGDYLTSLPGISNLGDWFGTAAGKQGAISSTLETESAAYGKKRNKMKAMRKSGTHTEEDKEELKTVLRKQVAIERDEQFMGIASDLEDKLEYRKVSKLRREEKRKNKTGERKEQEKEKEEKGKPVKMTGEAEEGTSSQVLSQNFEQTERAIEVLNNIAEALQTREFKTQFQVAFPRDLDTEIEQEIQSRGFDVNPGFIKNIFSYFTKGQIKFLLPIKEGIRAETIHCIVTIKGKKQLEFGDSTYIDIIHNGAPLARRQENTEVVKSENNAYLVRAACCPHNSGVVKKVRQVEPATLDGLKRITDQLANQASAPPANQASAPFASAPPAAPPAPLLQEHELPSPFAPGATLSSF